MEIVKAAGLKKYYETGSGTARALDGVSFTVEEGEFVAVVGTSGSGKTTLLNLLGGLEEPTSGGVWIRGSSLRRSLLEEMPYSGGGISASCSSSITWCRCSVYMRIWYCRFDWTEQRQTKPFWKRLQKFWDYGIKWNAFPVPCPGDNSRERPLPGRSLLNRRALLADEPTGNLDSATSREVIGLLKSCAARFHQTVLMVTHQEEAAQAADRILRIEDGRIAGHARDDSAPEREGA